MNFLEALGLLIGGLSILVTIHEFGHYLPAKLFGMKVEKFYLFFDWPRKLVSFKYKDTEYGIGLLPFGGYVKIAGIVDESMDTEHTEKEPQPWEFRSKPVWQRIIVMVGGVTMNVLLGIFIYSMLFFINGQPKLPLEELPQGIVVPDSSLGEKLGLQDGDRILNVNGQQVQYLREATDPNVFLEDDSYYTVLRDGDTLRIDIPNDFVNELAERKEIGQSLTIFRPRMPTVITLPEPNNEDFPAVRAGLQEGDRILAVDSIPVDHFDAMRELVMERKGTSFQLTLLRAGDTLRKEISTDSSGIVGVAPYVEPIVQMERYGFFESFGVGSVTAFRTVGANIAGLQKVISGNADVSKSVAGPIKIAKMYNPSNFWTLTAMLSMWLALINILPIPALDGGHLVFLLIEAITGKEPSLRVRMIAQQIGFFLMIMLIVLILFNDILSL